MHDVNGRNGPHLLDVFSFLVDIYETYTCCASVLFMVIFHHHDKYINLINTVSFTVSIEGHRSRKREFLETVSVGTLAKLCRMAPYYVLGNVRV